MARCFDAKKSKAGKKIKCGRCGAPILPGEQYFYFSVGFRGSKQVRCHLHRPKQSELCGSKMSGAYAAIEGVEDTLNGDSVSVSDIASALETAAGEIEQVRDEYQDSYDNLPENFQNGEMGEEIQSKIDGLEAFAETLNSASADIAGMESEEVDPAEESVEQENESVLDEAKQKAEEALGEFEL